MSERAVLQRVVFPTHGVPEAMPLFVDVNDWTSTYRPETEDDRLAKARGTFVGGSDRIPMRVTNRNALSLVTGRRSLQLPEYTAVSLASYFSAFPASYWSAWTSLTAVELRISTRGLGRVLVYRSNARGVIQSIESVEVEGETVSEFRIPFTSFIDGGWIWFDLQAGADGLELIEADWCAPADSAPRSDGNVTISITTLNRGAYCTALLAELGSDPLVLERLDRVLVVDQGSAKLVDAPGFDVAKERLGDRLRVIEQANLGGSGGFSRGMIETLEAGDSEYVLLLDDDVEIEPESVRRSVMFANYCTAPTIVGGHMFDMYDKSKLHAFAEGVRMGPFMWGPYTPARHDFATSSLRETLWMHRRFEVDYNGWWMSLIPVEVIRSIGLSLPVFIKWDDAEYSLRARARGYHTVSLPGAAVWHVSWVDKDDSHDWQAFFHARNRMVAALLHSPFKRGGQFVRSNVAGDVKELLTMHYYTVAARQEALRNVLEGPAQLHSDMVDRLPKVRAMQGNFSETTFERDATKLPHFPAREVLAEAQHVGGPRGGAFITWMLSQMLRNTFRKPKHQHRPQAHIAFQDARWFEIPKYDSVLVTNAEGSGVAWNRRDPKLFRSLLKSSIVLHVRLLRRWPSLARSYRSALPQITSPETWKKSISRDAG